MPRRKTLKLSTPADIRRSIGNAKRGNALLYACNSALNVIKTSELQTKLDELEALVMEMER